VYPAGCNNSTSHAFSRGGDRSRPLCLSHTEQCPSVIAPYAGCLLISLARMKSGSFTSTPPTHPPPPLTRRPHQHRVDIHLRHALTHQPRHFGNRHQQIGQCIHIARGLAAHAVEQFGAANFADYGLGFDLVSTVLMPFLSNNAMVSSNASAPQSTA